jgi:hypothetical protein
MSSFAECVSQSGLDRKIAEASYGKYGSFNEDAAKLIIEASQLEHIAPTMLAITLLNESVFNLHQTPNTNHRPDDPTHWDVGPAQLNVHWTKKEVEAGNVQPLPEIDIFGSLSSPDAQFDGDPLSNIRMCARRLLAIHTKKFAEAGYKSENEMRCVRYTGPGAQPFRLQSYREYLPLFKTFFTCYHSI